jgi:hypothetical protein
LLYLVGEYDRRLIASFKRTAQYEVEDYALVARTFTLFGRVVTLPNILTEVSNLAGSLSEHVRASVFEVLRARVEILSEEYVPSEDATEQNLFKRLGLTDSAVMILARDQYLVLTDDFRLSIALAELGIDHINLNHLRSRAWLGEG